MAPLRFDTVVDLAGQETEVRVEYRYYPGSPGKTYGPPENCYPSESDDADIEAVYRTGDPSKTDIGKQLTEKQMEDLLDEACERGSEQYAERDDDYEPDQYDLMDNDHPEP